MGWLDEAACKDVPYAVFFPVRPTGRPGGNNGAYDDARAICARCPVVAECYADEMAHPSQYGMRAGLTPEQRVDIRCGREPRQANPRANPSRPAGLNAAGRRSGGYAKAPEHGRYKLARVDKCPCEPCEAFRARQTALQTEWQRNKRAAERAAVAA